MSTVTKIRSNTTQKTSLQSVIPPEPFDDNVDEPHAIKNKPIQTRSKTKINKMKDNTSLMGDSFRKTQVRHIDGDESGKPCPVAGHELKLRKRQRPATDDKDNKDATTMDAPTTIKKHKLHSHCNDRKQHSTTITNSTTAIAASTPGSPLEISIIMDQQQTVLLSPMSPVPSALTANYNCSKKENDQVSAELVELGKMHDLQTSLISDGDDLENGRCTGAIDKNDLNVPISNIDNDSGGGDNDGNTNTSPLAYQHDQKTAVVNVSQDAGNTMDLQGDTESTCTTIPISTIKPTNAFINRNEENNTRDGHTQPVGFLKRVASYLFG